jgi:transposase-like protein
MDASNQFCPNVECQSREQFRQSNIVSNGNKRIRYKCKKYEKTFSARVGTALEGICRPEDDFAKVVKWLAYSASTQAIVHTFGLDERAVANWGDRAGIHYEFVRHPRKLGEGF